MSKSMTSGNLLKLILAFSIPLLLGNLFQQFYNIVDTAIVGQTLGSVALAGVGSSSSVQFLVLGFCQGICQGFSIPVAQKFGADEIDEMRKYVFNGGILVGLFAVVVTTAVVILCPQILAILQVNKEIYEYAYSYLVIIFAGIPFTLLYNYLAALLRAIGDSKTPFYFLAFSAILNIGLDFFCIINLNLGCAGAAIATIVSQAISGILCLLLIIKKFEVLHLHREHREMSKERSGRLLSMGVPMGLQFSITAIGSMTMQSANNSLGTIYVSGFTAGLKIKQLMMCPFDAIGATASTFLSQNYGAKKTDRIRQGFKISVTLGALYACVAGIIMIFFGRMMSMMFVSSSEAAVLDASALYLRRMGYFFPVVSLVIVMRMSIQGLGYSGRAMFGGILEMFARSFVAMVFVPMFKFDAITWTDQAAWVVAAVYLGYTSYAVMKHVEQQIQNDLALEK